MTFNILEIAIINIRCQFIFRNNYITFRPQFGAPKILRTGADVLPLPPPCYATDGKCKTVSGTNQGLCS